MNYGFKYLVVLKNTKGRLRLVQVRADNAREAKTVASEAWPDDFVISVKPRFSISSNY